MKNRSILSIEHMRFRWPKAQSPCLDIPDFKVKTGERVFLYGPSGSGKSTLLGLLGGVLTPECGSVCVLNDDLPKKQARARDRFRVDHIGFIFQQFNLIPHLSVLDNVLLPCRFSALRRDRATASGNSLQAEAMRLLSDLDLDRALQSRPVTELSVGQQQRVAAARALVGRPEIIIADEPTSSLDTERQEDFLDLLLRECEESQATVLFVSHDHRLATHFSREVSLTEINKAATTRGAA
ncbi:MAG: transporter related [Burkholderia sp.]|nr:transporter related [Burkholderia sp.]